MCVGILDPKMYNTMDRINICSFNCRSFKNSLPVIYDLCNKYDIVLLQEHWLIPNDLCLLNNAHGDFQSYGISAVDISSDILVGRPFGGTAVLYRKSLADQITVIDSDESRITGIQINTNVGPLLLLNVYMPTNYSDDVSLELYCDCLAKLHALIVDTDAVHTVIAGDFNCGPSSRFFAEFVNFAWDNNLVMSYLNRLNDVVTYISDDGSKSSWIDHILCSFSADNLICNLEVVDDVVISDHKPLAFSIQCNVLTASSAHRSHTADRADVRLPMWNKCDHSTLAYYASYLDNLLQPVHVPVSALYSNVCPRVIDQFYNDILTVSLRLLLIVYLQSNSRLVILMYLDGILTLVKSMMLLGKPIYVGVTVVNPSLVFILTI